MSPSPGGAQPDPAPVQDLALAAEMMEGVRSDPPWSGFVAALRSCFGGNHANLIFRQADTPDALTTADGDVDYDAQVERYRGGIADSDPVRYYSMLPFRAYLIEDFLEDSLPEAHPFTRDFLYPADMRQMMICKVVKDRQRAWITVTRPAAPLFTEADKRRFEALARLFAHALGLFAALKNAEDTRDAYVRLARSRATGLVRVDRDGVVIHTDTAARELLERGEFLTQSGGGILAAVRTADRERFRMALDRILSGKSEEEFLVFDGDAETSLEVLFYRVQEPLDLVSEQAPRAMVYLCTVGRENGPSPGRLQQLFALTPREAALTALLTRGRTLSEAAGDLGISEQTARAYLRQIFQKTSTNRQAELVRRAMSGIAAVV